MFGSLLLVTAVLIGFSGYAFYTPLPDGYCTSSTLMLQMSLFINKLVDFVSVAGSCVGVGSRVEIYSGVSAFFMKKFQPPPDPDVKETDEIFDGVPVRIYEPITKTGIRTGIVYYHGGGWTLGNPNMSADTTRELSKRTNSVVVSVDYRLAPEFPFPAAFDDCVKATKYFMMNALNYDVDPLRVAVAGDSAGGNLAAVVSLKFRDDAFQPPIKLQVLLYPAVQALDFQLPSMIQNRDAPMLSRTLTGFFHAAYLDGNSDKIEVYLNNAHVEPDFRKAAFPFLDVSRLPAKHLENYVKSDPEVGDVKVWNEMKDKLLNPYHSPLTASSLEHLPPAYVLTVQGDVLRDEGFLYVYRLKEAGVPVKHVNCEICIHGMTLLVKMIPEAEPSFGEMTDFVRSAL